MKQKRERTGICNTIQGARPKSLNSDAWGAHELQGLSVVATFLHTFNPGWLILHWVPIFMPWNASFQNFTRRFPWEGLYRGICLRYGIPRVVVLKHTQSRTSVHERVTIAKCSCSASTNEKRTKTERWEQFMSKTAQPLLLARKQFMEVHQQRARWLAFDDVTSRARESSTSPSATRKLFRSTSARA